MFISAKLGQKCITRRRHFSRMPTAHLSDSTGEKRNKFEYVQGGGLYSEVQVEQVVWGAWALYSGLRLGQGLGPCIQ